MKKKVLIYGGSGGIGSALANVLHKAGYDLHLVGRQEDRLEQIASETGASFTAGDVLDSGLFERVTKDCGARLDGLVYAIGSINLRSFQRFTEADYIKDFRVNAVGAALAVQAALPALRNCADTASIVLFSSIAAVQGFALHASMGMAKGAVNGLMLSLAAELAPKIRVNAVAPSLTRTPLASGFLASATTANNIAALHPLPRLGEPEDAGAAAAFLLSAEAGWITGQVISVDGGRSSLRVRS